MISATVSLTNEERAFNVWHYLTNLCSKRSVNYAEIIEFSFVESVFIANWGKYNSEAAFLQRPLFVTKLPHLLQSKPKIVTKLGNFALF